MVQKRNNLELDVIEVLLKNENYIRNIAKILNESHSTILRKLNNLKRDNVVDFKEEGRNKVFFLKNNLLAQSYIYKTELNKLIKLLRKHQELGVIFKDILKKTDARLIVLFGSYAKGLNKKDSDVDIYIETKNRNIKKEVEGIYSKINVKIGLFDIQSPLIKEIIKNHIIIRGVEEFYEKKQISE